MPRGAADDYRLRLLFTARPARPAGNTLYAPAGPGARSLLSVLRIYVPAGGSPPGGGGSRSFGSQFGNPQNAYLMTVAAHHHGQLVVIQSRVPTFPDTGSGDPVYGHDQLRYW